MTISSKDGFSVLLKTTKVYDYHTKKTSNFKQTIEFITDVKGKLNLYINCEEGRREASYIFVSSDKTKVLTTIMAQEKKKDDYKKKGWFYNEFVGISDKYFTRTGATELESYNLELMSTGATFSNSEGVEVLKLDNLTYCYKLLDNKSLEVTLSDQNKKPVMVLLLANANTITSISGTGVEKVPYLDQYELSR